MTAFTRRPDELRGAQGLREIVGGDGRNPSDVRRAVRGQDAVIAIVSSGRGPRTVVTDVARVVVPAMREAGARRLVWVSADPVVGNRPWPAIYLVKWLLRHAYADLAGMERLVMASDLDWTIVRPTRLTDGPATGQTQRVRGQLRSGPWSVSRADLAAVLLDEATSALDAGAAVEVTGARERAA